MFTRDSKILSHRLTTPLTAVANAVGDVFKPTYNQIIKYLFANNEQGFAYDPNDLTTMFQDAAGTVPVTGAGQAVGLILDKSKGLVVGPERLTNGDFSAGSAGWAVVGNDATHIITFANGTLRYQSDTATPVLAAQQLNTLTVGKWYEVTITISNYVSGALKSDGLGGIIFPSSVGTYKLRAIATSTTFNLLRQTPNVDITIDSVSVKELAGNHAYQTTSASRPILRQNAATGAYYLEFDGSDDHLITNRFPAMGLATTIFTGARSYKAATSAVVARGVGGYLYQTSGQVTVQSVNNPVTVLQSGNTVITVKYAASGTGVTLKVNNLSSTNPATIDRAFNTSNPLAIGAFSNGGEVPLQGHIYCLIGISKLTTDAESIAIEKEIAKRLGVTLNV